jgi:hypothetical protein
MVCQGGVWLCGASLCPSGPLSLALVQVGYSGMVWGTLSMRFLRMMPLCEFACCKPQCADGEWEYCTRRLQLAAGELVPSKGPFSVAVAESIPSNDLISPQVQRALGSTCRYGAVGLTGGLLWPPPAASAAAAAAIPPPPAIATIMRVEWVPPAEADGIDGNGSGLDGVFSGEVGVGMPDAFAGISRSSRDAKRYDCCD